MVPWCRSCLLLLAFDDIVVKNAIEAQSSYSLLRDKDGRSCDLECPMNAPCRFGNADFSERMGLLTVETETHRNGMHCDCPIGWTGILCDKKYETCSNQNGHECYNGGQCILGLEDKYGNEQLFCDCSNSLGFVGKYCETPLEKKCGSGHNENGDFFCVNGGECNPYFPESSSQPCFCDEGYEGYHCQYKEKATPECTLDCQNGGSCFIGVGAKSEGAAHRPWSLDGTKDHMYCKCLRGFGGHLCEAPAEQCGNNNDHKCLNGGKCITNSVQTPNGNVHSQHHCDCTMATNDNNDYFAGKYCEHKATSTCSDSDWNLFCTQGGTCKENPLEGCSCRHGTTGYKCEFIVDRSNEDGRLQNDNISISNESDDEVTDNNKNIYTNEDDYSISNTKTNPCADGYCLNGGYCMTEQIILQDGSYSIKEYCDCSEAYDEESNYAGPYCQYKSTSLCFVENASQGSLDESFCVHHGACQEDGNCDCPGGWSGRHCELKSLELDQKSVDQVDIDKDVSGDKCGETNCYNGGVCVQTERLQSDGAFVIDYHCDCSTAFDEKYLYAGRSCEFPSTQICWRSQGGQGLEGSIFCTNHGTCPDDDTLGCKCLPGFLGFSCEYESHNKNSSNDFEGEENDIEWEVCGDGVCHNGGKCITSIIYNEEKDTSETNYRCDCSTAYNDDTAFLGQSCEYPSTNICTPADVGKPISSAHFCVNHGTCKQDLSGSCDCGDGFTGRFCQYKIEFDDIDYKDSATSGDVEACGDDLVCLNGGKCIISVIASENNEMIESIGCDCDTTSTGFAGISCEHKATSICDVHAQASFCVNGGKCQENDSCICDLPWKGVHCELPVDPKDLPSQYDKNNIVHTNVGNSPVVGCNLKCENGGSCAQGKKDFGSLHDIVRDVAHLNQTYDDDSFAHCVCTDGWMGRTCENKFEVCGEEEHFCLHGSTCVPDNSSSRGFSCDCLQADDKIGGNNEIHFFAGDSCQYTDTDICVIGDEYPGQPLYFCVNGGICNARVLRDEPDPGCTCPESYTGPHCEVNITIAENTSSISKIKQIGLILGTLLMILCVLFLIFNFVCSRLTKEKKGLDGKEPTINVTDPQSPSQDICVDMISSDRVYENDGIMIGRRQDEQVCFSGNNPVLMENCSLDYRGEVNQDSHFV